MSILVKTISKRMIVMLPKAIVVGIIALGFIMIMWLLRKKKIYLLDCITIFVFASYTYIVIHLTLLNRKTTYERWNKLLEGWKFEVDGIGINKYEAVFNCFMFTPFIVLLFALLKLSKKSIKLSNAVLLSTMICASFSFCIEMTQAIFMIGTFQFADLVYNTLGGILGCLLYFMLSRLTNVKNKKNT